MIKNKIIQLKEEKDLKLKRCFIDEIGIQKFKGSGFEPQYNFFKINDKLEIRVELPGNVKPSIKNPEFVRENTIIQINGKKKPR
jgi:HSP20 family molecular chaperone IbpA